MKKVGIVGGLALMVVLTWLVARGTVPSQQRVQQELAPRQGQSVVVATPVATAEQVAVHRRRIVATQFTKMQSAEPHSPTEDEVKRAFFTERAQRCAAWREGNRERGLCDSNLDPTSFLTVQVN